MIPYSQFGQLRLCDLLDATTEIVSLDDWEFMDRMWVGEAHGFTECLRLQTDPNVTRVLVIDFQDVSESESDALLTALDLAITRGDTVDTISRHLGIAPFETQQFVNDRKTFEYRVGLEEQYYVSATILNNGGLVYLAIMRHDYLESS